MSRSAAPAPLRVRWAVELLSVSPGDHILEVGCGPGLAVAQVCPLLVQGSITAIDRSATAIERSRARNAEHVANGRAVLQRVELAYRQPAPDRYDKALAINVNRFWTSDAEAECKVLRGALRSGGVLRLVYEGPGSGIATEATDRAAANLERHGFTVEVEPGPTASMVCITGRLGP